MFSLWLSLLLPLPLLFLFLFLLLLFLVLLSPPPPPPFLSTCCCHLFILHASLRTSIHPVYALRVSLLPQYFINISTSPPPYCARPLFTYFLYTSIYFFFIIWKTCSLEEHAHIQLIYPILLLFFLLISLYFVTLCFLHSFLFSFSPLCVPLNINHQ